MSFFLEQKNSLKNKRCFILATGPSLRGVDLSFLRNEITIGVNQAYLATEKYKFNPTYCVLTDDRLYKRLKDIYGKLNSKICFTTGNFGNIGKGYQYKNCIGIVKLNKEKKVFDGNYSYDLNKYVYQSNNVVTDIAFPLAMFLGCPNIYLLGLDCSNNGYFYNKKEDLGFGQLFKNITFKSYKTINFFAKQNNFNIINLTDKSNLNVFPKYSYKLLINE